MQLYGDTMGIDAAVWDTMGIMQPRSVDVVIEISAAA